MSPFKSIIIHIDPLKIIERATIMLTRFNNDPLDRENGAGKVITIDLIQTVSNSNLQLRYARPTTIHYYTHQPRENLVVDLPNHDWKFHQNFALNLKALLWPSINAIHNRPSSCPALNSVLSLFGMFRKSGLLSSHIKAVVVNNVQNHSTIHKIDPSCCWNQSHWNSPPAILVPRSQKELL